MASVDQLISNAQDFAENTALSAQNALSLAMAAMRFQPRIDYTATPPLPPHQRDKLPDIKSLPASPQITWPVLPESRPLLDVPTVEGINIDTSGPGTPPAVIEPPVPAQLRQFGERPSSVRTEFPFPEPPPPLNIDAPHIEVPDKPNRPQLQMPGFSASLPADMPAAPKDIARTLEETYRSTAPVMQDAIRSQLEALLTSIDPTFKERALALEQRMLEVADRLRTTVNLPPSTLTPRASIPSQVLAESALYTRARRRIVADARKAEEDVRAEAAARGFTLPSGVVQAALSLVRKTSADATALAASEIAVKQAEQDTEVAFKNADIDATIAQRMAELESQIDARRAEAETQLAIKRAELEQQGLQAVMSLMQALHNSAINAATSFHGNLVQINGQALQHAQQVVSALVETYNASVRAYSARLDAYRAEAAVFEARVRATQAEIEVYNGELNAMATQVRVDEARMNVYRAAVDAANSQVAAYKTRVEAIATQAGLERIKLDIFGAQVQAFAAETQAKSAEWQGYSAAMGGNEARARMFAEQVRAYAARLDATRAQIDAKKAQAEAIGASNEAIGKSNLALIESYRAQIEGESAKLSADGEAGRLQLSASVARANAAEAQARANYSYYQTIAQVNTQRYEVDVRRALEKARMESDFIQGESRVAVAAADVYKGLASAALSGMNTLVSQSESR